jgi:hypothetical protein
MANLLKYISHLFQNESALKTFIVDPITEAENEHGLSKAERAVLRRTVAHLPNTALSGFSMERTLKSYRRSLRLLQNVLHTSGAGMVHDHLRSTSKAVAAADPTPVINPTCYTLVVYYPNANPNPPKGQDPYNFTKLKNTDVQNAGGPYANVVSFSVAGDSSQISTINDLLTAVQTESKKAENSFSFTPKTMGDISYISAITITSNDLVVVSKEITADPTDLDPTTDDYVFWFYSLNGAAGPQNSGHAAQGLGYPINDGNVVMLQIIAPDSSYGFAPC